MCGFEQESIDVFTSVSGAPLISGTNPRTGGHDLYIPQSGIGVYIFGRVYLTVLRAEIFVRVYALTVNNTPVADSPWIRLSDSNDVALLEITETGQVWLGQAGAGVDKGNIGPLTTSYKRYEIRLLVDNAAGLLDVRVDGVSLVSDFGIDTRVGSVDDIGVVLFGSIDGIDVYDAKRYDDVAINNTLGVENNSWCGQGAILHGVAVDNGNVNDFGRFPDTGEANWEDVDETPPDDDTTYVIAGAIADTELYNITNFEATYGLNRATQVKAVAWWMRARLRYNGDGELAAMHRQGGLTSEGDQYAVNEHTYDYIDHIEDIDPATVLVWDIGDVDDSEFGFRSRAP